MPKRILWMVGLFFWVVFKPVLADLKPWNNPYTPAQLQRKMLFSSFSQQPKRLDPAVSYVNNEWMFILATYEPPLHYHYLKRPYELVPLTLTHLPTVEYLDAQYQPITNPGAYRHAAYTRYTLTLQPEIHYQPHPAFAKDAQGHYRYHQLAPPIPYDKLQDFPEVGTRTLTAADYVYQIKRLADPRLNSPIFDLMSQYILGLHELHDTLKPLLKENPHLDLRAFSLTGAKALDDHRYQITIRGQYPAFLHWLTMPFFCPMPWEADAFYRQEGMLAKNLSIDWYPISTGPFMLVDNNPERHMMLVKNPNFRHETFPTEGMPQHKALIQRYGGQPLPLSEGVLFTLEKEGTAQWHKFLQGYYDTSPIGSDEFQTAIHFDQTGKPQLSEALQHQGITLRFQNTASFFYLGFNFKDEVIGGHSPEKRQWRRYIAEHLDLQAYINLFMNGRAQKARGPIPPDIEGYELQKPLTNTAMSKPANMPTTLYFDTFATGNPEENTMQNWLKDQFAAMGIDLVIRSTDSNRYQDKVRTGNVQLFIYGWIGDYPDPENFLSIFYGPNANTPDQEGFNLLNYKNPDFDRDFEALKVSLDQTERRRLIEQLLHRLDEDQVFAFAFYPQSFILRQPWLGVTEPGVFTRNPLKYLDLDPEQRRQKQQAWNQPILWPLWVVLGLFGLLCLSLRIRCYWNQSRC